MLSFTDKIRNYENKERKNEKETVEAILKKE